MTYLTVTYPPEHYPNWDAKIIDALGPPPNGKDSSFSGSLSFDGRVLRFRFESLYEAENAQARIRARLHNVITGVMTE